MEMNSLSTWDLDVMKEAPADYCDILEKLKKHHLNSPKKKRKDRNLHTCISIFVSCIIWLKVPGASTRLTSLSQILPDPAHNHHPCLHIVRLARSLSLYFSLLDGAQPQPFEALCKHFRAKLIRRVAFSTGEECVSE